jgi:immunity protein 5 of polymorphic toxin system
MELSMDELRAVAGYAVACATPALDLFETARPGDMRPRAAVDAASAFATGGRRTKAIRDCAWAAQRAYRDAGPGAAGEAARAAVAAAGAAYLHPLARATQVLHILGAAGHAAYAFELAGRSLEVPQAGHVVVNVLKRYPPAPAGRGRVGELVRQLDASLRGGGDL